MPYDSDLAILSKNPTLHPVALPAANRSILTRVLHALILASVLNQLIGSYFLSRPMPGEAPELSFVLHEYVGMGSLALVALFWLWTLIRKRETSIGRLVPWFSRSGITSVMKDVGSQFAHLRQGTMADDPDSALASAVHGLGLLTLTTMALTGTVYFFITGTHSAKLVLSVHKLMSNLMWGYLFAHAGLAVLHQLLGSDMISRMFWHRRSAAQS